MRRDTFAERVTVMALELFYSIAVSYFAGKWAIAFALAERGYKAVGGELLIIPMAFALSYFFITRFFENYRR